MREQLRLTKALVSLGVFLCVLSPLAASRLKRIKPSANPPQYVAFSQPLSKDAQFQHALDRLTFGPQPGDLEKIQRIGLEKWVGLQLHPEELPKNPTLEARLEPLDTLRMSVRETILRYPPVQFIRAVQNGRSKFPNDPELRAAVARYLARYPDAQPGAPPKDPNAARQISFAPVAEQRQLMFERNPEAVVASDLAEGKLLRAIYSTRQLQELLVDFWYNHFNVFLDKGADHYYVAAYEREAIRPHVLGKFYDLLLATAESPAMMFYLDNWQSAGPPPLNRFGQRPKQKRGLNENYGRELLELHTLGVNGGYTQKDVIEVARCFTGWTIEKPNLGGGFIYNDKMHDKGPKVVLGHLIPAGGGMNDGLEVLDILAHHPATAHHISFELAQRFAADDPPPSLVNRMAETFLKTGGDLRKVMVCMLSSPEFWSQGAYRAKVKTPFEMVVSAVRASNANVESAFALANQIQRLGEPLYRKREPDGYSNANAEWVSAGSLVGRMNFALAVAQNHVPGTKVDLYAVNQSDSEKAALMFGSPEFQKH